MEPIIYVLKNPNGLTEAQRNVLLPFVSDGKFKRIKTVRSQEKADSMLLVEVLLKYAVKKEFGLPMQSLSIMQNENGKPFFPDALDVHFSISHSGEYVAVAFYDRPIGVDIQKIGNFPKKVAERVCSEKELNMLMCKTDKDSLFTKLWTQKEAALKMQGQGIFSGNIGSMPGNHKTDSVQIEEYWLTVCVSN